jgi:hypothetical protein
MEPRKASPRAMEATESTPIHSSRRERTAAVMTAASGMTEATVSAFTQTPRAR